MELLFSGLIYLQLILIQYPFLKSVAVMTLRFKFHSIYTVPVSGSSKLESFGWPVIYVLVLVAGLENVFLWVVLVFGFEWFKSVDTLFDVTVLEILNII